MVMPEGHRAATMAVFRESVSRLGRRDKSVCLCVQFLYILQRYVYILVCDGE